MAQDKPQKYGILLALSGMSIISCSITLCKQKLLCIGPHLLSTSSFKQAIQYDKIPINNVRYVNVSCHENESGIKGKQILTEHRLYSSSGSCIRLAKCSQKIRTVAAGVFI